MIIEVGSDWTIDKIRGQVEPLSRHWMARCLEAGRCTWSLFRLKSCLLHLDLFCSLLHGSKEHVLENRTDTTLARKSRWAPIFFGTPVPPRSPSTRKKTSGEYPGKEIGVRASCQLLWSTSYFHGSFCFDGFPGNLDMILFNPMLLWDSFILR